MNFKPHKHEKLLRTYQAQLESLPGYSSGNIIDKTWTFKNIHNLVITINFDEIEHLKARINNRNLKNCANQATLKLILLSLLTHSTNSIDIYKQKFNGLLLLFYALESINSTSINKSNLREILRFLITHRTESGHLERTPSLISYTTFIIKINLSQIQQATIENKIDLISNNINQTTVQKTLERLIPEISNNSLSYRDWVEGESLDFLTLDHGKYYIEHCLDFYHDNYALARALSETIRVKSEIAIKSGYSGNTIKDMTPLILRGYSPKEIKEMRPSWRQNVIDSVHEETSKIFSQNYCRATIESSLLSDNTLEEILESCGIQTGRENIDRARFISWFTLNQRHKDEATKEIISKISFPTDLLIDKIEEYKNEAFNKSFTIPRRKNYLSLGLTEGKYIKSTKTLTRQLVRYTVASGVTSIVALTGWRRSEFGFPVSSILAVPNNDKLDQHSFPLRFFIDWYVHKTNGKVKIKREITFNIYIILQQLSKLADSHDMQPCIYEPFSTNAQQYKSDTTIQRYVKIMWGHFVLNYKGFERNTYIEGINKKNTSKETEGASKNTGLTKKTNEWNRDESKNSGTDLNLKATENIVKSEWPTVEFFLTKSTSKDKRDWLVKYKQKTLRKDWMKILDDNLTNEMKMWINDLPEDRLKTIRSSRYVSNQLMEGIIYPSPHAFRHMWAESVYRRFDGDVGWMIRSQFKHVSNSMWLSYIRDKDNRSIHEQAERVVISSIVKNYVRHKGNGYTGQLNTWLRRLGLKTSIYSMEEKLQLAERIATSEISSVKANPWGYCLLRKHSHHKAKCSISGEPQRYNASPELCLNCTHNLMQTGNLDWALLHVSQHVEAIRNDDIPAVFQQSSYRLVKSVYLHAKSLSPKHSALPELKEALEHHTRRATRHGS